MFFSYEVCKTFKGYAYPRVPPEKSTALYPYISNTCYIKTFRNEIWSIQGVKKFRIQTLRVCRGDKTKPFCYVTNIWQVPRFRARGSWRVWRRMVWLYSTCRVMNVLQKLLKMSSFYINAQLVSACKWLSPTNNCCSFCHTGNQLFWSVYRCFIHQTLHLPPQIKKFIGVRTGERGGHCTGPPLLIQRLGKTLFRYSLTSRAKCAGVPLCWNHNRCLTCSGTFSNISGNMSRINIM